MSKSYTQWGVISGHILKGKGCTIPSPFLAPYLMFGMTKKQERRSQGPWMVLWSRDTKATLDHLHKTEINYLVQPVMSGFCYMHLKWYPNSFILLFL